MARLLDQTEGSSEFVHTPTKYCAQGHGKKSFCALCLAVPVLFPASLSAVLSLKMLLHMTFPQPSACLVFLCFSSRQLDLYEL